MERRRSSTLGENVASVTLSQMVDMALNNPEVGVVRFNILQSLLHAILRTLGIGDVEAVYEVAPVTAAELSNAASPSGLPDNDVVAPLIATQGKRSSIGLPVLHIVMPAPATCELVPTPGTTFHEVADKVKKMEVRLERLYNAPSNEELIGDVGASPNAVANMWQNLQLMRKVEANADAMKELMALSNELVHEHSKQWDEAQSLKQQMENISRIINTEMEVPSFVTWSGLEEILKGVQSPMETASGPSTALKDHMKIIGKIDQEVTVLDEKCQVLDEKVQVHEVTLNRIEPNVVNLVSAVEAASCEISSILRQREVAIESRQSDLPTAIVFPMDDDQSNALTDIAGNVRQLVTTSDSNLKKIHEHLNFSCASIERRLLAVEEIVAELRETVKLHGAELKRSGSDIELTPSSTNLGEIFSLENAEALSRASSGRKQETSYLTRSASSLLASFDVGKQNTGSLESFDVGKQNTGSLESFDVGKHSTGNMIPVSSSSPPSKRNGDIEELRARIFLVSRKLKLKLKQDKVKMEEFASKMADIAAQVKRLRKPVSCDEAEEDSCLRLMQRSVEQLQADIRNVTQLGLDARALTEKVQQFEVSQGTMLADISEIIGKFGQLESLIADLESKIQTETITWNQLLESVTDTLRDSMKRINIEMVSVRKDVQCHLLKLNDDVGQLHRFLDEFGDSGAGLRTKLKSHCLSCDRKILVNTLEPPSDSCPVAQARFQSSLSAHPYTSFEIEKIRNRQKTCLLPRQRTNFQRSILERHVARLRMRDFRGYSMHGRNDLPEVKMAKSNKCSTLYEKKIDLPDISSRLSRSSGEPMHMPLSSSSGHCDTTYGNRKGVEYVDPLNLAKMTSANTVANKSTDLTYSQPAANTNSTKKPRGFKTLFQTRRNFTRGKKLPKCNKLLVPDDPQDAHIASSVEHSDQETQQSTSLHGKDRRLPSPVMSSENLL